MQLLDLQKFFTRKTNINKRRFTVTLIILVSLFLTAVFLSLILGAQKISFNEVFKSADSFSRTIFFSIRLPRTILVIISGILLSGAGAVFQMFFRNPLAEPGIMGITSGASLGAVIAACLGGGTLMGGLISLLNGGAFLGALAAAFIVTAISFRGSSRASTVMVLLCGTALGSLYSAITSIILAIHDRQLHSIYIWMLGSFSGRGWNEVKFIIIPSAISILLMLISLPQLDLLGGGEATARTLGVDVKDLRLKVIVAGAFASSASVCAGGTIGFIGLIAPHAVRQICGSKGKVLLPFSMLAGATLLLLADTLCRIVIAPSEIPVGTITSILGVPFFISLLLTSSRESKGFGGGKNA